MDFSFLKFYKNNLSDAIANENNKYFVSRFYGFVQMLTNETFTQITNCKENIAFGGNIKVELIDCSETILQNITDKFYYQQFTDINGIKQISFEFGQINKDYYNDLVFLKLNHTQSNNVWYSNGFFCTDINEFKTVKFVYKNESYFRGISYENQNYFQSIRLVCYQNDIDSDVETENYKQLSGTIIDSRSTITDIDKYQMDYCDNFTYKRLVTLFNHDIVYIDGQRISNKPKVIKGERIEDSNIFEVSFETNPTNEFFNLHYQIYEEWRLIPIAPKGNFTFNSFISKLSCGFNKTTILSFGTIKIFNSGNVLIQSFNQSEMTLTNNILTVNTATIQVLPINNYYLNVDAGLFLNETKTLEIKNKTDWTFNIIQADFDNNDFNNNDFLT